MSSHSLAKELLNKPDCFLTVTIGEKEYVINDIRKKYNHANSDDWCGYYTLECEYAGDENIKR